MFKIAAFEGEKKKKKEGGWEWPLCRKGEMAGVSRGERALRQGLPEKKGKGKGDSRAKIRWRLILVR